MGKRILMFIIALTSMSSALAQFKTNEAEVFNLKKQFEEKAFQLKIEKERKQILKENKTDFDFFNFEYSLFNKSDFGSNLTCADWVYQGPGSREEAIEACRGVRSMECVEFVYKGPGTRRDAAMACRQVESMECVEWVYRGPGSRTEAAEACHGVRDMECVNFAYRGSNSRVESARSCDEYGGRIPRRDDDCRE